MFMLLYGAVVNLVLVKPTRDVIVTFVGLKACQSFADTHFGSGAWSHPMILVAELGSGAWSHPTNLETNPRIDNKHSKYDTKNVLFSSLI